LVFLLAFSFAVALLPIAKVLLLALALLAIEPALRVFDVVHGGLAVRSKGLALTSFLADTSQTSSLPTSYVGAVSLRANTALPQMTHPVV
jgi:hypothetical protein